LFWMPKETKKVSNSSSSTVKKKSRRASVDDWGGMPRRSEKYGFYDTAHSFAFGSGAPELAASLPPAPASLDTSAQLPTNTKQVFPKKTFVNRARAKFLTNEVVTKLSNLPSALENSYKTTARCSGHLTEASGKLSGLYCGQRWCLVCSRIRTARCIAGYLPALESMSDKWFLTLTRRNCTGSRLKTVIREMIQNAQNIHRVLKEKHKLRYSSLRKIECTYNEKRGDYHPHFHFIFSSELAARTFLAAWLRRYPERLSDGRLNPDRASPGGQDLRRADNKSCLELFKYFTKVVSKTKGESDYRIHVRALDTMFLAMRGVRTFQPTGGLKLVSEDVEELQAEATNREQMAAWSWLNGCADWVNAETGELLTGYSPTDGLQKIASHIVEGDTQGKFAELPTPEYEPSPGEVLGPWPKRPSAESNPSTPTECEPLPAGTSPACASASAPVADSPALPGALALVASSRVLAFDRESSHFHSTGDRTLKWTLGPSPG
jgi:hypothetical protein